MQIFSAVGKKTFGKKGRFVVEAAGEELCTEPDGTGQRPRGGESDAKSREKQ